nr:hypothetical protein [Siccirubricoccus sp. G192]
MLLAALLPALLVGGLAVGVAVRGYRAAFEARLQDTARALSLAMDQEIAAHLQTLEALAGFTGMDPEDGLAGFDALARSAAVSLGTSIFVYGPGPEWQQWVNTAKPLGSPLPAGLAMGFEPRAPVPRVFATGRPALGDIATGRLLGLPRAAILVPIRQGDQVRAALGAILDPSRFSRTLASLGLVNGTVAMLIDGQGVVAARSERAGEMTGRFMPAWYAPAIADRSNGLFAGQGLDGQPMILAFQRLATDPAWTLVVTEPASAYRNAWQTPLIALAIGGGAALAFGLLVAGLLARRLLRPLHALVGHAEAAAAGGSPIPPPETGGGIADSPGCATAWPRRRRPSPNAAPRRRGWPRRSTPPPPWSAAWMAPSCIGAAARRSFTAGLPPMPSARCRMACWKPASRKPWRRSRRGCCGMASGRACSASGIGRGGHWSSPAAGACIARRRGATWWWWKVPPTLPHGWRPNAPAIWWRGSCTTG